MSDGEFLARWSRRKREAMAIGHAPPPKEPAQAPTPAPSDTVEDPADPQVDISSLPPIDSINAATDVTAFLRGGVPLELSRAALRRAWSSDPAIRDFIGLAENAWDFNDPNAMPGFGPLDYSAEQVEELVARIVGSVRSAAECLATAVAKEEQDRRSIDSEGYPVCESNPEAIAVGPTPEHSTKNEPPVASVAAHPPESPEIDRDGKVSFRRRTHGGALPS